MKRPGLARRVLKAIMWWVLPRYLKNPRIPLGLRSALHFYLFQRVFGINRDVPWPVHWSSIVPPPHHRFTCGVGTYPGVSPGVRIQAINGVELGHNVWVGPGVKIVSANHNLDDYDKHDPADPIVIGDDCWLGANAVVLPGVRLGNHVVVAAGAVVAESFAQDNILLAGVPARVVKRLGPYLGTAGRG